MPIHCVLSPSSRVSFHVVVHLTLFLSLAPTPTTVGTDLSSLRLLTTFAQSRAIILLASPHDYQLPRAIASFFPSLYNCFSSFMFAFFFLFFCFVFLFSFNLLHGSAFFHLFMTYHFAFLLLFCLFCLHFPRPDRVVTFGSLLGRAPPLDVSASSSHYRASLHSFSACFPANRGRFTPTHRAPSYSPSHLHTSPLSHACFVLPGGAFPPGTSGGYRLSSQLL